MNYPDGRRMILDLLTDKSNTFLLTVSEKEGRNSSAKIMKKMQVTKRLHLFISTKEKGGHVTYIDSHFFIIVKYFLGFLYHALMLFRLGVVVYSH